MKKYNYIKGKNAEDRARKYLQDMGFVFIESNFDVDLGEIDLVMSDHDWLVFVEVKFKADDSRGLPEEMIGKRKLSQIRKVAEMYLLTRPELQKNFCRYRIDAVCILDKEVRYYSNLLC